MKYEVVVHGSSTHIEADWYMDDTSDRILRFYTDDDTLIASFSSWDYVRWIRK